MAGRTRPPRPGRGRLVDAEGQPYTATTWTLNTLREGGLDAAALSGPAAALAATSRWEHDELPDWGGEVDCCINAFTLANGAWLGADVHGLVEWFLEHQLDDGGWNCEWVEGSTRSSFHSTLNTIRGLLSYEQAVGGHAELAAARHRGEEYLLQRRLRYGLRSGEPVAPWTDLLAYPTRWVATSTLILDHLVQASHHDGTAPDARAAEAVDRLRAARDDDGRWRQGTRYRGLVWFDIDVPVGESSPWLTFIALRVLGWWDGAAPR